MAVAPSPIIKEGASLESTADHSITGKGRLSIHDIAVDKTDGSLVITFLTQADLTCFHEQRIDLMKTSMRTFPETGNMFDVGKNKVRQTLLDGGVVHIAEGRITSPNPDNPPQHALVISHEDKQRAIDILKNMLSHKPAITYALDKAQRTFPLPGAKGFGIS